MLPRPRPPFRKNKMVSDTIFAPATPTGCAIAIIRISGADAFELLRKFFIPASRKTKPGEAFFEPRRMVYGSLTDGEGGLIDMCSAVFYKAPASYTGEDMAEVFIHGSAAAMQAALHAFASAARPAEAGEFTKRAFINGKLDLTEAEAVMDMISANTELSRKAAAEQLKGGLGRRVNGLYDRLTDISAYVAALTDYPEEMGDDIETEAELAQRISAVKADIDRLIQNGLCSKVLREGARAALMGPPNAGKSSLLNALLSKDRAIVTELPGTTRDTLEESVSVFGVPVVFIDTAGLRDTVDTVERMGVERAVEAGESSDLILWLRQGDLPMGAEEERLFNGIKAKKHIVVFTKCDLWSEPDKGAFDFYKDEAPISLSSAEGAGVDLLKKRTAWMLRPTEEPALITNSRHIDALKNASAALEAAAGCCTGLGLDCCATDLNEAMHHLGLVTGRDAAEDLIDAVFSRFCVGK